MLNLAYNLFAIFKKKKINLYICANELTNRATYVSLTTIKTGQIYVKMNTHSFQCLLFFGIDFQTELVRYSLKSDGFSQPYNWTSQFYGC